MRTLSFLGLDIAQRPRLSPTSIRQLATLGTVARWPGLLFAAVLSLVVPPKLPIGLALLLVWVAVYNAWGIIAIARASDGSILRIARALTLTDTVSYFLVLFVFGGVGASTSIYATYILLIVWMVAYDGADGALICVAIFVAGMVALHAALKTFFNQEFAGQDILLWSLIMVVAGAILVAYDRIVLGGVLQPGDRTDSKVLKLEPYATRSVTSAPSVRLSPREHEVLQLMAEGYSNAMIANRLHLAENTVKTHVENVLGHFNARNRAEAVAAASRQNLI